MSEYILDATSVLRNESNSQNICAVAKDLDCIKRSVPNVDSIILRGGAAIDVINGIEPNDIDLFYAYLENGIPTQNCVCDRVREQISTLSFEYFKTKEIDLENAYEKEPRLDPILRTVGLFSYHTDYTSQFAIDENGHIWTNVEALQYFRKGEYEIRYEGFLPWAYFPHEGDSNNYWGFGVYMLIRGIGYIVKRNLKPGKRFSQMFSEYEYYITRGIQELGVEGFRKYAKSKIKQKENFETYLTKFVEETEQSNVRKTFLPIIEALSL